jgi:hypothetical protein
MLEISEQPTKLLERRAPREGAHSLAFVSFASAHSWTFEQLSHRFALARSNSFRMKLLHKSKNNFRRDRRPGRIVSRGTLLESADSGENRFQKPAKNKSLRITSLYKRKNNCPGITLLQKKVGGGVPSSLTLTLDGVERPASFGRANLLGQRIDVLRRQFPAEFGHAVHGKPPFAIGDDVVEVFGGRGSGFYGSERWPSEKVAPGVRAVTFGAVFLEDRVCGQARL